jgi:hypothetical protein
MSSDSEKKGSAPPQQFAAAPQFPPGVYPFPQGNVQFQPVFYQPVPYDVATSVNAEQQAFLEPEGEKKCFFSRICKRWRNRRCARKCGKVCDDGRALGNLNNFIAGLLFGTFSPFFSLLCVFGFETKKLTRTGTLFGHANFFLLVAACLLAFGTGPHGAPQPHEPHGMIIPLPPYNNTIASASDSVYPTGENSAASAADPSGVTAPGLPMPDPQGGSVPNHDSESDSEDSDEEKKHKEGKEFKKEGKHGEGKRKGCKKMYKIAVGVSFAVGIIFLIASCKSMRRFMAIYRTRENKTESEVVKVVSEAGNCRGFFLGFIASLVCPWFGTALVLIIRRKNLTGRYGALHGLGVFFVIVGIVGAFHGVPPVALLKGLLLCQISSVHFKRAIASANAQEEKASNC